MPRQFRTVRELIHWEYAKLIAGSATGNRAAYAFANSVYMKLNSGNLRISELIEDNKLLMQNGEVCAYCGSGDALQWEHIVPRAMNGPESIDNLVLACAACNRSKGAADPYGWYSPDRMDSIPRLVLGKLLKLLYMEYDSHGLLDSESYMREQAITRIKLARIFKAQRPHGTL